MPVKSKLQFRYMEWAKKHGKIDPKVADEFINATPSYKNLPEKAPKKKKLKDVIKK